MKSRCHWKIKMQFTMDHTNVEWLDKKKPINHPFKALDPTNLLFPQFTFPNVHLSEVPFKNPSFGNFIASLNTPN